MKVNFENKINRFAMSGIAQKTIETSKKVAKNTKDNVSDVIGRAKNAIIMNKLKKLNPVFPAEYKSEEFKLPNIIMIVDDAVRRGNKLCEGAVGWLTSDAGVEMFCLYDEAIEFSGIQFVPTATCDAIYCVDSFNKNRFIRTDCIFSKAHEEKIAELKYIAYCLGAKKCAIEINESQVGASVQKRNTTVGETVCGEKAHESLETVIATKGSDCRRGKVEIEFEGNVTRTQPELKWFTYDDNIRRLIEMSLNGNSVKSETIELLGSSFATMSQKTACAIDSAMGGSGISMSSQVEKEYNSKFIYHIEF